LANVNLEATLSIEKSNVLVNNCQPKLPELSCTSHYPTFHLHPQYNSSCEDLYDGGILLLQDGGVSIPHSRANQYLPQGQQSLWINC